MSVQRKVHYVNKVTYKFDADHCYENTYGESLTVPNETMTIKEIMQRALNGIAPEEKQVLYLDAELDSISRYYSKGLDITEVHELREANKELASKIEKAIKDAEHLEQTDSEDVSESGDTQVSNRGESSNGGSDRGSGTED